MPAIGPQYLPIRVIADWRCLTRVSGFTCAAANPAKPPSVTATTAATRLFLISFAPLIAAWAASVENTFGASGIPLAQARSILRDRADLAIGQARRHPAHHAVRVVRPPALFERFELAGDVIRVLPGDARILRGHTGTGRSVTAGAGGYPGGGVAAAPEALAGSHQVLIAGGCGLQLLPAVESRQSLHVGLG